MHRRARRGSRARRGAASDRARAGRRSARRPQRLAIGAREAARSNELAVEPETTPPCCLAEAHGALARWRRTPAGRRSASWLITRRISLVAVCCSSDVGQLAVARLELLEQPHVLDRDDRLVGEGLEERDLRVGERPGSARATTIAPIGLPRAAWAREGRSGRREPIEPATARRSPGRLRCPAMCDDVRRRGSRVRRRVSRSGARGNSAAYDSVASG